MATKLWKMDLAFVVLAVCLLTLTALIIVKFERTESLEITDDPMMAIGKLVLTHDGGLLGDEVMAPAIVNGTDYWSLEIASEEIKAKLEDMKGKRVAVWGRSRFDYHDVAGVQRFLIVSNIKALE